MKNPTSNPIKDGQPKAAVRPVVKKRRLTNPDPCLRRDKLRVGRANHARGG